MGIIPVAAPKINTRLLAKIANDARKTAAALHLLYVSNQDEGIERKKVDDGFVYTLDGKKIKDEETLLRIKRLAIPPAWEKVWICSSDAGHLQATGIDLLGRKQYRYHESWGMIRNQTKFYRMLAFGEALPQIRKQLQKDLAIHDFTQAKVLAIVVTLLESTHIRVGNQQYERLYGTYGLSTLKNKHLKLEGNRIQFVFKGKKGIKHDISINNRRLAKVIAQVKDIPGKELFQYFDGNGVKHKIDSGMVNSYIKSLADGEFTAKDFRTWAGTLHALNFYKSQETEELSATALHRKSLEMLDYVASKLGNTRSVCKKYYVNPLLVDLYEQGKLEKILSQQKLQSRPFYTEEESILLNILGKK